MNQFLSGVARAVAESFDLPSPVLEIGSHQVAGQEAIINLRGLFPWHDYLGVDMRPGPGVDCVADVEHLPQADASIGTVIAMNTFEHVCRFWRGFEEVHRVLRPDGVLLMSSPFYFHIHSYPSDYWRFTPEALHLLLESYPTRIVGWQGPRKQPVHIWAVAFREQHAPVTASQFKAFRRSLASHAHERLRWSKVWRYRLGRLLCGRTPFAPYLDLNRGECSAIGLAEELGLASRAG